MLSCLVQVVQASDVLFLFGGAAAVRDTLKSVKDDLKGHQIIVPVTKDGDIDNFQVLPSHAYKKGCLHVPVIPVKCIERLEQECCFV